MSTVHCCFQPKLPLNEDITSKMLEASEYWKPDKTSSAVNNDKTCCIAKASLFNTSLSKMDDVYTDSQTGAIITANARLDNRDELIKKLELNNDRITDGELILQAYLEWGKDCPKYLLGDFVFIIWDEIKQKVFCARDHFGVKLFLYSQTENGIMISNEPNAFFTSGWLEKEIKESWLVEHLWNLGNIPLSTAYSGLEIFHAGHFMEIDSEGKIDSSSYWELTDNTRWENMDDEELLSELKRRFQHAVEVRLESDYPLSCELSEGLDSNGIAGFAAKLKPDDIIHTLSYDCTELTDETRPVFEKTYKDIFDMLKMHDNLHPIWTKKQEPKDDKENLIKNTAGALALRGGWMWHCKLAHKKGARVILAGWGGDHCVSTYGDFYESELFNNFKFMQIHELFKNKNKRGRVGHPFKAWIHLLIKHFILNLAPRITQKRYGFEHALWERRKYNFLKQQFIEKYNLLAELEDFIRDYRRYYSTKAHHKRELFDIGVEKRLIDSELSARMFRMEFRYPMLDIPLVEFAYNLPSHLKINNGIERYAFRKIIKGVTTERTRNRIKSDVSLPNKDLFALTELEKKEILDLFNTPYLKKYCNAKKLGDENQESKFMLKQFYHFSHIMRYFANNKIPIN